MPRISIISAAAMAALAAWPASSPALAHPGGLAKDSCHTDRSTGERHCHRTTSQQPAPPRQDPQRNSGAVYFPNCDAVRAAGRAPIYRGEPGYRPALDRDNDGIACEPYGNKR